MNFDPAQFKSHFPLFAQPQNQSLVYLDNAATTQKPQCVLDAIGDFYLNANGNAQRASHRLARLATALIEDTRVMAANFLGAASANEVAFTQGATQALNLVAFGLTDYCQPGDEVVVSHMEHHANLLPWQRLVQAQQCHLQFFPEEKGLPQWHRWPEVITSQTRVLAISAASNVLGVITDLSWLADIKRQYPELLIVLDASQLACHQPLHADQWPCDFLVCSAHKFYGPTGVGLLYGREPLLHTLSPLVVGGEMVERVERQHSTYVDSVHRLEAGTTSMAAIAGLQACLSFWQQQPRQLIMDYEAHLLHYLHEQVERHLSSQLQLLTSPHKNVGIATCVSCDDEQSMSDLADYLDQQDIAVRVGDHCAQPLWASMRSYYQRDKGLRVSLSAYNTRDDIDRLIVAATDFFQPTVSKTPMAIAPVTDTFGDLQWEGLLDLPWQHRYKTLLRWGSRISPKPAIRQPQLIVKGCESQVWLSTVKHQERYYFELDSDSNVIKGLAVLLLVWVNGRSQQEIMAIDIEGRYQQLGFDKYLSQSRMNGFKALLDAIMAKVNQSY